MIGLKTEIGKGFASAQTSPSARVGIDALETLIAPNAAGALGMAVRERVSERGDLAGQHFPGWDALHEGVDGKMRGRRKFVSARYPDRAQGVIVRGAEKFDSSEVYHRANGTRPGTYRTTGGMWSGLSRVIWSARRTDVVFRGRSDGQDPRFVRGVSRPLKVSNGLKASTVLNQHGINVLAITEDELAAVGLGATYAAAAGVGGEMPVQWQSAVDMSGGIEGIFLRAFRVSKHLPTAAAGGV